MARATESGHTDGQGPAHGVFADGAAGDRFHLDTQHVYRRLGLYDEPAQEGSQGNEGPAVG